MVGYVESWGWTTTDLPTAKQLGPLTDVVLAFGISYTSKPSTSSCAAGQCKLAQDPIWAVGSLASTAKYLKATGAPAGAPRNALLSFGGWSQGHCDENSPNCAPPPGSGGNFNCWAACLADPAAFATQMVTLARPNGFDGVELDYETNMQLQPDEEAFLVAVTQAVRTQWPAAVISHTIQESFVAPDADRGGYPALLQKIAGLLDFASIQFYDFGPCPVSATADLVSVFSDVVKRGLGGDASKLLVGLTIDESNSHACYDVPQAADACAVMKAVAAVHPELGGAMVWQIHHDLVGWSHDVGTCMAAAL